MEKLIPHTVLMRQDDKTKLNVTHNNTVKTVKIFTGFQRRSSEEPFQASMRCKNMDLDKNVGLFSFNNSMYHYQPFCSMGFI